ncbi:MAG: phage tail sheath family protein [Sandaracinaceae bacterium]|nr:phage tail sheath family protein [Sandaracinaceae bacterium]
MTSGRGAAACGAAAVSSRSPWAPRSPTSSISRGADSRTELETPTTEQPVAEYLAPGVYIEETSFRSKSIEGVSTSTTAFVGPTRRGPVSGSPELLTSFADFERIYGSTKRLALGASETPNYVALAVQAYFDNGGSRLYVARTFEPGEEDGLAEKNLGTNVDLVARFPGESGNGTVVFKEAQAEVSGAAVGRLPVGSVISIEGSGGSATLARRTAAGWTDGAGAAVTQPASATLLTLTLTAADGDGNARTEDGLGYDAAHARYVGKVLEPNPARRAEAVTRWFALEIGTGVDFEDLRTALLGDGGVHVLDGGDDGDEPSADTYRDALAALEALDDISIVAAPGHSEISAADAVRGHLVTHVEKRGLYRIAVLDSSKGQSPSEVRTVRGGIDSHRAAMYYPWVTIANPLAKPSDAHEPAEIDVPPSGFVCGVYARSDVERGVWKSPANEVVRGALRFEKDVSFGENELLNPLGVNCLRYFPGRGYRVWGARTASSDPEWKYVSVRRYFNYLEASIERGTQWSVFEPNGPALWANVRETISSFLYSEWKSGALLGDAPKEAYFVRCDRTTMTQNDLDNGRMVCLIGVAVVKPAEFVIFRIGQKTASARD